jgi:hypothetical protein
MDERVNWTYAPGGSNPVFGLRLSDIEALTGNCMARDGRGRGLSAEGCRSGGWPVPHSIGVSGEGG